MNAMNGTLRLVYEDAVWFIGKLLLLYISLPLTLAWLILGFYVDLPTANVVSAISGPAYFFLSYLAIAGFQSLFPVAIGMGGTRTQFLKCYYTVGISSIVIFILLLNVCQYILVQMSHTILHPAVFIIEEYHFISFFWIDLIFALFLFGVTFLLYSIWYRLGTNRSLILMMVVTITFMFLYYGGFRNVWLEWLEMAGMYGTATAILLSVLSLSLVFLTYPLMKHAPLSPKSKKGIRKD